MKKILLSVFALASMAAHAEYVVNVVPVTLPADIAVADIEDLVADEENYLGFALVNPEVHPNFKNWQVNIFIPNGFGIDEDNSLQPGERMPTTNKGAFRHGMSMTRMGEQPIPGYTGYQIVAQTNKEYYVQGNSGEELIRLYLATSGVEEGIYPIYTSVLKMAETASLGMDNVGYTTSYVKVGNPSTGSLTIKGELPSFVNEALVSETAISSLDLSAATAVNGEFAYTVGRAVTAPSGVDAAVKVVVPCDGDYASLKSPVALPGVKCYTFSGVTGDVAKFTETTGVPAGEAVIIDEAVNAQVASATLASVENGTATAGSYYVAPDGSELRRASNTPKVPALRGVWEAGAGSNLRIAIEGPTGLRYLGTAEEVFGNTYDLQGRQTTNAKNGVYVVNGKKQFVK